MADRPFDVVGMDALSPHLERVRFPATKEEVDEAVGDVEVPVSRDLAVPFRRILEHVAPRSFDSGTDLERAVERVWDAVTPLEARGRGNRQKQRDRNEGSPRPGQAEGGGLPRKRTRKLNQQDPRSGRGD